MFWRVDFAVAGPGAALGAILARRPNTIAMARTIAGLAPDILVLSGVDHDPQNRTAEAFNGLIADQGLDLPHVFAPLPNAGIPSGVDLNGDGKTHGEDDAHGYGPYPGARALLLLSRYPWDTARLRDFSRMLWRDMPGARLFTGATPAQLGVQRLSSNAHIAVPVLLPDEAEIWVLAYHAGPPLFGFHPDRNLNRNHDETAFWSLWLSGALTDQPPQGPIVLAGGSNLDPFDGDGVSQAMRDLLAHPRLQDPRPTSAGGAAAADADHTGPAAQDTAAWDEKQGNLRVSYVLPSADLTVRDTGVLWPLPGTPVADLLASTGTAHKPVWLDLSLN